MAAKIEIRRIICNILKNILFDACTFFPIVHCLIVLRLVIEEVETSIIGEYCKFFFWGKTYILRFSFVFLRKIEFEKIDKYRKNDEEKF